MSSPTLFDDFGDLPGQSVDPRHRVLVLWYPDWPVIAAAPEADLTAEPVAVFSSGAVLTCSAHARAGGVRRGMRRREAQSRIPELRWLEHDPAADARAFEPVLAALEQLSPGVELIRPGMCATGARGPSAYFGGEAPLIDAVGEYLESLGYPDARFGIADGSFAAAQAARLDAIVPPGETSRFLADLPVDVLDDRELTDLLRRMGLRTLGAFAALPRTQVSARFGAAGVQAHRLAAGRERRRLAVRTPPPELTVEVDLDPPVEKVDVVAFTMRRHADAFVARLSAGDLVCSALAVTLHDEHGGRSQRVWRHPRWFTAADVIDRVRWQVQAATPADRAISLGIESGGELTGALSRVVLSPRELDRIGEHADELWGGRDDEKVHRAFTRVQSMLDHTAVLTPVLSGGRSPRERYAFAPWGEAVVARRDPAAPWPGRLPDPAPSQLPYPPESVLVIGANGPVQITDRGVLSSAPEQLRRRSGAREPVESWAGPWHSDERWWDTAAAVALTRIQATTSAGAYLLAHAESGWWIEGIYD